MYVYHSLDASAVQKQGLIQQKISKQAKGNTLTNRKLKWGEKGSSAKWLCSKSWVFIVSNE